MSEIMNYLNIEDDSYEVADAVARATKADRIVSTLSNQSVASFSDGADGVPMSTLNVTITPTQSGSGDPSPTNIRPFNAWTGAKVRQTGKNLLWQTPRVNTSSNRYFVFTGGSTASTVVCSIPIPPQKTLYVRVEWTNPPTTNNSLYGAYAHTRTQFTCAGNSTASVRTFTIANTSETDTRFFGFWGFCGSGGTFTNTTARAMCTYDDYADWEAPETTLTEVTWSDSAGTVYGGTLDVLSGKLTVTHGIITMDGTGTVASYNAGKSFYAKASNTTSMFYGYIPNDEIQQVSASGVYNEMFECNMARKGGFPDSEAVGADELRFTGYFNTTSTKKCQPRLTFGENYAITTVAAANAWLATQYNNGTPVQYSYPLYTPLEYDLTPTQVQTLLGINNIWADCGDIAELTYTADTKLYIDNAIATAIASI